MVFTFYALCVLFMMVARPWIVSSFLHRYNMRKITQERPGYGGSTIVHPASFFLLSFFFRRGRSSIYAALYFLPVLALAHATLGGLIYMSYPHVVLVLSLVSCAAHFAYKLDQSARALLSGCVGNSRNLVILIGEYSGVG